MAFLRKHWMLAVVILIAIIFSSTKTIPAEKRGLKFTLGKVNEKVLSPGLHFNIPLIQSIKTFSLRPMELSMEIEVGPDGAITKDNQTIGAKLTAFYKYTEHDLVTMYKDYGETRLQSLITKAMDESFKAQVGTIDIFDLPVKQDETRGAVFNSAAKKMHGYPIVLTELRITNYDWSEAFDAQIEETMKKAQQVRQMAQDLEIKTLAAQKKVKEAIADKEAAILRAEGEKQAIVLASEARVIDGESKRQYNESIRATLDIEVAMRELDIREIEARNWNGAYVPSNNYGPIPVETGTLQPARNARSAPTDR